MSQYKEARERTKAKIEDAYWDLMISNERITVKKIIEKAGVHKSTFYFYYEWIDDVLTGIKDRMMKVLVSTIESKNRDIGDFKQVMIEMRKMFQENRKYLVPLVLEQRGGDFAVNYREYIKEHFAEDIGLDYKTGNGVKNDVANCVLAGLVEMMLYELSSEIIPDEFTYKIGDGIIKKGVALTLIEDLNIKFGK
ncbi:MAG: TetR/AcrR family transcriptional regulator [Dehalococcoidales bacterium]|nr:TetR/AcrR family transcriptional regulator [Dehalococcoidales bacterium]